MEVYQTNDYSIVSKRSMCDAGYFEDEFIKFVCPKAKKRSPIINYGYCVRATVVDYFLRFFQTAWMDQAYQVLCLGAGYDTTYFRLFSQCRNVKYFEIDLPEVVRSKTEIILGTPQMKYLLSGPIEVLEDNKGLKSDNYVLFSMDLGKSDLKSRFSEAGIDLSTLTLIFSECATIYLTNSEFEQLVQQLISSMERIVFGIYEPHSGQDTFGSIMTQHFENLGTPIRKHLNWEKHVSLFSKYNWSYIKTFSAMEVYRSCLDTSKFVEHSRKEPFDEWEELYLKCSHYCLIVAANFKNDCRLQDCSNFAGTIKQDQETGCIREELGSFNMDLREYPLKVERFGHSTAVLRDGMVIFGGMDRSGRCRRVEKINADSGVTEVFNPCGPVGVHLGVVSHEDNLIIFGGRLSPSQEINCVPLMFNIEDGSQTPLNICKDSPMPSPRYRHSFVSTSIGPCVFGGRNHRLEVFNDLWILKNASCWENWCTVEPGPCPRFSHSATVSGDKMYISGGLDSNLRPLNDVWYFDFKLKEWKQVFVLSLFCRFSHTSHVLNDYLILIGGVNDTYRYQPAIAVVDLRLKSPVAREFHIPVLLSEPQKCLLFKHATVVSSNGSIITIGGGGNCFSFGTHFSTSFIISSPTFQY